MINCCFRRVSEHRGKQNKACILRGISQWKLRFREPRGQWGGLAATIAGGASGTRFPRAQLAQTRPVEASRDPRPSAWTRHTGHPQRVNSPPVPAPRIPSFQSRLMCRSGNITSGVSRNESAGTAAKAAMRDTSDTQGRGGSREIAARAERAGHLRRRGSLMGGFHLAGRMDGLRNEGRSDGGGKPLATRSVRFFQLPSEADTYDARRL